MTNRKYTMTKKNGGQPPPLTDSRLKYVAVGCQKCYECRKQKARSWQARLTEDIQHNTNGKFITLTFNNKSIATLNRLVKIKERKSEWKTTGYERDNKIASLAIRLFLERWRKKYKKSLRHWFVTELGHEGTENIHLHGIIWTNEKTDLKKYWKYGYIWEGKYLQTQKELQNYVNEKTINYIVKYVSKQDQQHPNYISKILTSKGIGKAYTLTENAKRNAYNGTKTKEYYQTRTGYKLNLAIYWRNKMYTEEQREQLWINKLNQNIRYVKGEKVKVDTQEGQTNYYKLLEYYQRLNTEMGYGGMNNWEQEEYENQRRNMLRRERIRKAKEKPPKETRFFYKNNQDKIIRLSKKINRKIREHKIKTDLCTSGSDYRPMKQVEASQQLDITIHAHKGEYPSGACGDRLIKTFASSG